MSSTMYKPFLVSKRESHFSVDEIKFFCNAVFQSLTSHNPNVSKVYMTSVSYVLIDNRNETRHSWAVWTYINDDKQYFLPSTVLSDITKTYKWNNNSLLDFGSDDFGTFFQVMQELPQLIETGDLDDVYFKSEKGACPFKLYSSIGNNTEWNDFAKNRMKSIKWLTNEGYMKSGEDKQLFTSSISIPLGEFISKPVHPTHDYESKGKIAVNGLISIAEEEFDIRNGYRMGFSFLKLVMKAREFVADALDVPMTDVIDTIEPLTFEQYVKVIENIRKYYFSHVAVANLESRTVIYWTEKASNGSCVLRQMTADQIKREYDGKLLLQYYDNTKTAKGQSKRKLTYVSLWEALFKGANNCQHTFTRVVINPYRIDEIKVPCEPGELNIYMPTYYIPGGDTDYKNTLLHVYNGGEVSENTYKTIHKYHKEFNNADHLINCITLVMKSVRHIENVICGGYSDRAECFVNLILIPFCRPRSKAGVCIVLQGDQGTGKSMVFDGLIKLLSETNILVTDAIDTLLEKFNINLMGKGLVIGEEFQYKVGLSSKLKNAITAEEMMYHQKRETPFMAKNINNFILITNDTYLLPIEQSDRRYVIFKVSNSVIRSNELKKRYFDHIARVMQGNTPFLMKFYLDILWAVYYKDNYDFPVPPSTELYKEEQKQNRKLSACEHLVTRYTREACNMIMDKDAYISKIPGGPVKESTKCWLFTNISESGEKYTKGRNIYRLNKKLAYGVDLDWFLVQYLTDEIYQQLMGVKGNRSMAQFQTEVTNFYRPYAQTNAKSLVVFKTVKKELTTGHKKYVTQLKWPRWETSYIMCYIKLGSSANLGYLSDIYPKAYYTDSDTNTKRAGKVTSFSWNVFIYWFNRYCEVMPITHNDMTATETSRKISYLEFISERLNIEPLVTTYKDVLERTKERIYAVFLHFSVPTWYDLEVDNLGYKGPLTDTIYTRSDFFLPLFSDTTFCLDIIRFQDDIERMNTTDDETNSETNPEPSPDNDSDTLSEEPIIHETQ
jgi:Family of unknown function (DUF5906)